MPEGEIRPPQPEIDRQVQKQEQPSGLLPNSHRQRTQGEQAKTIPFVETCLLDSNRLAKLKEKIGVPGKELEEIVKEEHLSTSDIWRAIDQGILTDPQALRIYARLELEGRTSSFTQWVKDHPSEISDAKSTLAHIHEIYEPLMNGNPVALARYCSQQGDYALLVAPSEHLDAKQRTYEYSAASHWFTMAARAARAGLEQAKWQSQWGNTQETASQPESTEAEHTSSLSDVIRNDARQFMDVLSHPDEATEIGQYIKKFADPEVYAYYDPSLFQGLANRRYHLPVAFVEKTINPALHHLMLLLKAPYQGEDGKWRILIYDPYLGKQEQLLDDYDEQKNAFRNPTIPPAGVGVIKEIKINGAPWQIRLNTNLLEQLTDGQSYDLSANHPSSAFPALQAKDDHKSCVPYSAYMAMFLNGLRNNLTETERAGIRQFEEDFDVKITSQATSE